MFLLKETTIKGTFIVHLEGAANSQRAAAAAAAMQYYCLKSCYKALGSYSNLLSTQISPAHFPSICGTAGSHQTQSSTQQDEVAQTAAIEGTHTKTLFCWDCEDSVLQQNACERQNTISMQGSITAGGKPLVLLICALTTTLVLHDKVTSALSYSSACRKPGQN